MEFLFDYFVCNSILAAGLALAVVVVTRLWRNAQLAHVLWIVVLLKLVSPPLVPVPVDAFLASAWHRPPQSNLDVNPQQPTRAPDHESGPVVGLELVASSDALTDHDERSDEFRPWTTLDSAGTLETSLAAVEERPGPTRMWLPIIAAIWLTGSLLRLALVSSRVVRFHRVARNMAPADAAIQKQAASLAKQLKLRKCPDIRVVEGRIPPMVWSASWKPLVLLPVELLTRLDANQQASLLMHELAHIRRRDHWVRWLEMAVLTICWWNPVAWWARSRIQSAAEECCDGWVVSTLPHCVRQYGKALLETVEFLNERSQPLPAMASGFGHVPLVKRRIEMIVKRRVSHRLAWPGVLLALLVAVVVLPVVAQDRGADANPGTPPIGEQPVNLADNEPTQSDSNVEGRIKRLETLVEQLVKGTRRSWTPIQLQGRSPAKAPEKVPSRVFPQLRSGIWRMRHDHKVDGKVVTDGWCDFQLDFRNDRITGHYLKISDGTSSDNVLSGELFRARSNPSSARYGRFVSVLVLRDDTSRNGYFVITTAYRVSENRFLGTYVDSIGQMGDYELTRTKENKK